MGRNDRDAKEAGIDVTCEVTPHHLFMGDDTLLPPELQTVKPPLNMMKTANSYGLIWILLIVLLQITLHI